MSENADSKPSVPWLRALVLCLSCAGVVGGIGCATMGASSISNPLADRHFNTPVLNDSIFALARPEAALARKIGCDNAIAFLGKKHTYLLVEGGETLSRVAQELEGDKLTVESVPRQLFLKDKAVWGTVSLRYVPGKDSAQEVSDKGKLLSLGFQADKSGAYRLAVPVKGTMWSPAKFSKDLPEHFVKDRAIALYNPPGSSPPPDVLKLVEIPLGVAVDVALTPVYVLGFTVFALSSLP